MKTLLVDAPTGEQQVIVVDETGGYFDPALVLWDDSVNGQLPTITVGGMVLAGNVLEYSQARMDIHMQATAPKVPQVVTRRQARQALLLAGLLDSVPATIAAIADPIERGLAEIDWADAQEFRRDWPTLLNMAAALGLTSDQIDQIFITAAGL